jgi:hypothetical protein
MNHCRPWCQASGDTRPLPLVADDPQATGVSDVGVDQPLGGGPFLARIDSISASFSWAEAIRRPTRRACQAEQTRLAAHSMSPRAPSPRRRAGKLLARAARHARALSVTITIFPTLSRFLARPRRDTQRLRRSSPTAVRCSQRAADHPRDVPKEPPTFPWTYPTSDLTQCASS